MRKNAGFIITTLLLLIVPTLANAWMLTVKVAGGDRTAGNYVEVVNVGTVNKILANNTALQSGTTIVYPNSTANTTVTIKKAANQNGYYRQDNDMPTYFPTPANSTSTTLTFAPGTGNHTVVVAYDAGILKGFTITQDPAGGGMIYAQLPNNTWTTSNVSGLKDGTLVPVTIAADANHKIVSYAITGLGTHSASATVVDGKAGQVLSDLFVRAGDGATVTAVFGEAAKISATLFAPINGVTSRAVNCTVTATSNVAGLTYAFAVTGPSAFTDTQAASNAQTFSFTPTAVGSYTVTATVESPASTANGGVRSTTATATIVVADAVLDTNSQCTSCHKTSFPAIEDARKVAIHAANIGSTCQSCHTKDAPHSAGALMGGALQGKTLTFTDRASTHVTTLASFDGTPGPTGITTDGTNLYVAEYGNSIIRKVAISSGDVGTVLGAGLNGPNGITTDGTNLYIPDTGNNTIRKVVIATGDVSTFVATPEVFSYPNSITTDDINLYVTDYNNHVIRKVTASGVVTVFAGTVGASGSADGIGVAASFNHPNSITTDGINLYVTDQTSNTIRKVEIATQKVSTIAGLAGASGSTDGIGSLARFNLPVGITTDGTNLYVADRDNHAIRKVEIATQQVSTIAGLAGNSGSTDGDGTQARFNHPMGITNDGINLYVTDFDNNVIRKLSPTP